MSLNITKSLPYGINYANDDLLVEITSTKDSEFNFAVVMDLKDENNNLLLRTKQRKGLGNRFVFDLNNIIYNQFDFNSPANNPSYSYLFEGIEGSVNRFKILFGEEYSSSPSSSIILYNGSTNNEGQPTKTMSSDDNGFQYFSAGTKDNSPTSIPYITTKYHDELSGVGVSVDSRLTNHPSNYEANREDLLSITIPNGGVIKSANTAYYNDVYAVRYDYYDSTDLNGTLLNTDYQVNINAPLYQRSFPTIRTGSSIPYANIKDDFFDDPTKVKARLTKITLQGSPSITIPTNAKSYRARVYASGSTSFTFDNGTRTGGINNAYTLADVSVNIIDSCDNISPDRYQFAWVNEYGVIDHFSFDKLSTKTINNDRTKFTQTYVDWDNANTTLYTKGGKTQLQNNITTKHTATTRYLTQEIADWLESLWLSPRVWVYNGSSFLPTIITSVDYRQYTNNKQDKLKSYTIEFEYSNDKRPR